MKNTMKIVNFLLLLFTTNLFSQITYQREFPNVSFTFPVELQFYKSQSQSERVFVVEQAGKIKVFPKVSNVTTTQVTTFLDITDRVLFSSGQEVGLLGMTFHPNFETNRYIYLYQTKRSSVSGIEVKIVISRYTVNATNPNLVDKNSELELFSIDKNQNNSNHNGGKIAFGTDGYLYFSVGDGGGGNDPMNNAQNLNSAFGKICRIDVDLDGNNPVESNPSLPNGRYEIPKDNPFVDKTGLDEIYAYGIRNTWKFCFDKPTNRLWGADVGQGAYEEVNLIENGKNYGWKRFEGTQVSNNVTINGTATEPILSYSQSNGDRSITGGYVYRGTKILSTNPTISEKYIFGDYVSGRVWALNYNVSTNTATRTLLFKTNGEFISSFGEDSENELYFSSYGSSAGIYKLKDGTTVPNGEAVNGIGSWEKLTDGTNGIVNCVTKNGNNIYYGGSFNKAGTIMANNIAVWNGTTWSTLGTGSNGAINAIAVSGNKVYVGGAFSQVGGVNAKNIAVWNGTIWAALGSGTEGPVAALAIDGSGNVFAGGAFNKVGTITVGNIARWNGTQWNALTSDSGTSVGTNNEVRALAYGSNGTLYIGGNFDKAGTTTANRIATWNGTTWGTLGTGTSGFVEAIAIAPDAIYLGGNFASAGSLTVNRIAKWNTTTSQFEKLGNGVSSIVKSILSDGTNIYAAGSFINASNTSQTIIANGIARWNPTEGWKPLGQSTNVGVNVLINGMTFAPNNNNRIFTGGNFSLAGNSSNNNVALWKLDSLSNDGFESESVTIYPNPTSNSIKLEKVIEWALYNVNSQKISEGNSDEVSLSDYANGVYFLVKKDSQARYKIIKK